MKHLKTIIAVTTLTVCLWSLVTAILQAALFIGTMTIVGLALIQLVFFALVKPRKSNTLRREQSWQMLKNYKKHTNKGHR